MKKYEWTIFLEDFTEEPFSFKTELTNQLWDKGNQTGIKQFQKYNFQLIIGMSPLNIRKNKNKTIINVEFVTPTSMSFLIDISWKFNDNSEVDFNWEKGFPLKSVIEQIKPYKIIKSKNNNFGFDIEYFHLLIPDIEMNVFFTHKLSKQEIDEINSHIDIFKKKWNMENINKPIQYISELIEEDKYYLIILDIGIKNSIKTIETLLKKIGENYNEIKKVQIK